MTADFFRARLDQMIDMKHPLAVLAQRLPRLQIEEALAPSFSRKAKEGQPVEGEDLFGPTLAVARQWHPTLATKICKLIEGYR